MQLFQHLNQQQQTILMVSILILMRHMPNVLFLLKMAVYITRYNVAKKAR